MQSKKDFEKQSLREISNYKWIHPYMVYCKGNSELIFRNVHYNSNRVILPLTDFFIGFVQFDDDTIKNIDTSRRKRQDEDNEEYY